MTTGPTYRTDGDWGTGKGANLTAAEIDENFWYLDQKMENLEDDAPIPPGIFDVSVVNSLLYLSLTNGQQFGPFALPEATFIWKGEWSATTTYFSMDVVYVENDGVYLVLIDHFSAGAFDPDAENTEGALYHQVFGLTPGGTSLVKTVAATGYQLILDDSAHFIRFTADEGALITVPANATVAFLTAAEIAMRQSAAGPLILEAADGVTLLPVEGRELATNFEGAVIRLKKTNTNEWAVWGDLAPEAETETAT